MSEKATRILLIEDNPGDARLFSRMLRGAENPGFDIQHVKDLHSGLQSLNSNHFDVILLDLSLPDSVGLEAVSKVRAAAPDMPIVVLSGMEEPQTVMKAIQGGVRTYLKKSAVKAETLIEAVSSQPASVSWNIKVSSEELAQLRQIAEEIGKNQLMPKPSVTALLHKAIQSYIAAWENRPSAVQTPLGRSRTASRTM